MIKKILNFLTGRLSDEDVIEWIRESYPLAWTDIDCYYDNRTNQIIQYFSFNLYNKDSMGVKMHTISLYLSKKMAHISINGVKCIFQSIKNTTCEEMISLSMEKYSQITNPHELDKIHVEDMKLIFSDLLDLDGISNFQLIAGSIHFSCNLPSLDYKIWSQFYHHLDKSISHVKSLYDVDVVLPNIRDNGKWKLQLILKD